jgi:hypothetical protein
VLLQPWLERAGIQQRMVSTQIKLLAPQQSSMHDTDTEI